MNFPLRFVAMLSCIWVACLLPPATAQDIRQKVAPAAAESPSEAIIDLQGTVYGLPFGASEEEVMTKFGRPAGYLRLDTHRTAMIYGRSHLLLCLDGLFDAVRIDSSVVDRAVSSWMSDIPPFTAEGWQLSDGIKPGMSRKEVQEIVKAPPGDRPYRLTFPADQCVVQLSFSHYVNLGEGDEAYKLASLLVARRHDDKDHWSQPPEFVVSSRAALNALKGRKAVGMLLAESKAGVRVSAVYRNSPADKAEIRAGDLITRLDGESVVGVKTLDFSHRMEGREAHDLEITAASDGKERHVRLERVDAESFGNQMVGPRLELTEVKVGDAAPDFEAKSMDGTPVKLSDWQGSPVLINFTATWCVPCRQQAPALVAAYAKYKERGLKLVSVYLDAPDKDVFAHARELGADWPIHTDGQGWDNAVARTYGVTGVPTNVLIGKDGKIVSANLYGAQLDSALKALK